MLRNTFLLLPSIGAVRERRLWERGILTWEDFVAAPAPKGISTVTKTAMDELLMLAKDRLDSGDSSFFAKSIPSREQWRCLGEFGSSVAYLDIETTGTSIYSPITLVGVYDGKRMHTLVRGRDLNPKNLSGILRTASLLVTFNGSSFDLPVLRAQFPGVLPPVPHIDLRHPLKRLGFTGGLKKVERQLGIERERRLEFMTSEDAAYLWRLWVERGKENALELLIEYNAADCMSLKTLADYVYWTMRRRVFVSTVRELGKPPNIRKSGGGEGWTDSSER